MQTDWYPRVQVVHLLLLAYKPLSQHSPANTIAVHQSATPICTHYMCKLTKTPSFHQHHLLLHGGEEVVQGNEEVLGELNKIHAPVCRLLKKGETRAVRQYYMCLCLNVHVFFVLFFFWLYMY